VLVVDDEPAIRLLCRVNLELEGYRVLEASSLTDARRRLAEEDVALVLLDMRIGSERGESMLDELQALEIPVVLVTGSVEIKPSWNARAAAVLGKPFAIDDLLRAVRALAVAR
jgi:DNA-binding NtrC family response regulator